MIRGRCPVCSTNYTIAALEDLPSFPFCSQRCRLIDLARWADGRYVIPGPPVKGQAQEGGKESSLDDGD
jgi:endogenous inhibitor of DNA gyrase (YacG/DUF329 family)